jgi:hypothetical protein
MSEIPRIGAFAIVPSNNLPAVIPFWERLGFRPGGVLRHREWGLYEVGIAGPDGLLVRIGWPSELIRAA